MRHAERVPDDDVLVPHVLVPRGVVGHAVHLLQALVRPLAAGPEVPVAVARHPDVVLREAGAPPDDRVLAGEEQLRGLRGEFEPDGVARDAVELVLVDDLEDAVLLGGGVGEGRLLEGRFHHPPRVPVRVLLVAFRDGDRVFLDERVRAAVEHRVDAQAEQMLVVLCQDARGDNIAPGAALSFVDQRRRNDARGPRFEFDGPALVEQPGKDVLVVPNGDDILDN